MLFEGGPGEAVTTHLDLVNSGTTALYYSWECIPNPNPLGTSLHEGIQRFYFDTEGGKNTCLTLRTQVLICYFRSPPPRAVFLISIHVQVS